MYSPIQLDIIRTFGNKDINFGCRLVIDDIIYTYVDYNKLYEDIGNGEVGDFYRFNDDYDEILGHIPELFPDVARVTKEKGMKVSYLGNLMINTNKVIKRTNTSIEFETFNIPYNPTLPLINQEESTLVQLLNLFK